MNEMTMHLFFIYWLPPVVVGLISVYGRSYVISEHAITKINHITGKKECVYKSAIGRIKIKPIAFGYGHIVLVLAGGHTFKIKNIKLPRKTDVDCMI